MGVLPPLRSVPTDNVLYGIAKQGGPGQSCDLKPKECDVYPVAVKKKIKPTFLRKIFSKHKASTKRSKNFLK